MEETSLDTFFDSDSEETEQDRKGSSGGEETEQESGDGESAAASSDVSPATSTAQWTASGSACEQCETKTGRLWNDDEMFVCRECKDW